MHFSSLSSLWVLVFLLLAIRFVVNGTLHIFGEPVQVDQANKELTAAQGRQQQQQNQKKAAQLDEQHACKQQQTTQKAVSRLSKQVTVAGSEFSAYKKHHHVRGAYSRINIQYIYQCCYETS